MVATVPTGASTALRLIGDGVTSATGVASWIRPRSLAPRFCWSNSGSLNVALASTTVPGSSTMLTVLKWIVAPLVTASCDGSMTTAGSTQCPAVSTQLGVISVPVHRKLPTSSPTTVGYWPTVVVVPPMISGVGETAAGTSAAGAAPTGASGASSP